MAAHQEVIRKHHKIIRSRKVSYVIKTIRSKQIVSSDIALLKSLPVKMSYITLKVILQYLEQQHKIMRNKDGSIVWIYADTPQSRKSLAKSIPLR